MIVTPVRAESPSIMVAYPTVTPGTSVIALHSPVLPSNGIPRSRARVIRLSFYNIHQLVCNVLNYFIGDAIHRFGLDPRIDAIVDVIHNDKFFLGERDLSGEPIQLTDGCDALCDFVKRGKLVAVFIRLCDS